MFPLIHYTSDSIHYVDDSKSRTAISHTAQVVGGCNECNVRMNIVSLITAQHCNHLSPDGPVGSWILLVAGGCCGVVQASALHVSEGV